MARIASFFSFITACGALSLERQGPDDSKIFDFGKEAEQAEAAALRAREEAEALASVDADAGISERQMDAYRRLAETEVKKESSEESMMERVVKSMEHEAASEDRVVSDVERQLRHLEGSVRQERSKKFAGDDGDGWHEDEKLKREELRERKADQEFAREQRQAAKLMVEGRKQADKARAREKMELHRRAEAEHETQLRLALEADALRQEAASNGTLPEEEVLQLLDMSSKDLAAITKNLSSFGPENMTALWIEDRLDGSRAKYAAAAAKMLETIRYKVDTFKSTHQDYDDHQFLAKLAQLIGDTKAEIRDFGQTKEALMTRLHGWDKANGEKLTYTLALAVKGVTESVEFKNHLLGINEARLTHGIGNITEACGVIGDLVRTSMQPAYKSLGLQRETLDGMSKITPTITANMPAYVQKSMANRSAAMVNMAYMEHLALKESATAILQDASPVVLSRLHCTMNENSGSPRSRLGVAALAAAVAWLAL
mmetsp:Transcript_125321/g.340333  ORF Transcript_125321/g.340333 Transcript_125321/m.340333 type:complete len:487 (-) Transcript_125321:216-1676(-)